MQMQKYVCLFVAFWLLVGSCLAQDQRKTPGDLDGSPLRWFEDAARDNHEGLIFKSLNYTAPYSAHYYELRLERNGAAFSARVVPNWAVQNSQWGKLSAEQVDEVKRMLAAHYFQSPPPITEPKAGERYNALIFFNGRDYSRYDYSGPLPVEVQAVIDFVKAEIERQEKVKYEKWLEEHKQKLRPETSPLLQW